MQHIHIQPLADEELRQQLEAGATIIFDGQTVQWHEIERQVERLGFGNLYVVSATQGPPGDNSKISLKPEHQRQSGYSLLLELEAHERLNIRLLVEILLR